MINVALMAIAWIVPNLFWCSWLAVGLLIFRLKDDSPRRAGFRAYITFMFSLAVAFWWVPDALEFSMGCSWAITLPLAIALLLVEAAPIGVIFWLARWIHTRANISSWLILAPIWVSYEFFWPKICPWLLGYSQIEFLPLSEKRILVILVVNDTDVQNRILHTDRNYTASELQQAQNFINEHYAGTDLHTVRENLLTDLDKTRDSMNQAMHDIISVAHAAMDKAEHPNEEYVLAGETNLMSFAELSDVDTLRRLPSPEDQAITFAAALRYMNIHATINPYEILPNTVPPQRT